jgi:molybdenum cofactor biosynthesis enzyme MoaA
MNNYLLNPNKLQFEISSMCNALCLGCVRTDSLNFSDKKDMIPHKQYLDPELFKKIIAAPEFATVRQIEFCGTIDDPLMHPNFLEILESIADHWQQVRDPKDNSYTIFIHTNASLRTPSYFAEMAKILKRVPIHNVKFSIDGMEDTNHLYRQNTSWKKIMENAEAFINAGGTAHWQYLIFPWNEHQLMQAKELSVKMKFFEFSSRHDRSIATGLGMEKIQKIKVGDIVRKNVNSTVESLIEKHHDLAQDEISCNNKNKKMYFISFEGRLWPCCFLHNGSFSLDAGRVELLRKQVIESYEDPDWNRLDLHSVGEVLNHEFYTNNLVESWQHHEHGTGKTDRILRCSEVCGVKRLEVLPIGNYKLI